MKLLIIALVAGSALAAAAPASAQRHNEGRYDQGRYSDWEDDARSRIVQQINHAYEGIEHGLEDGSFTRWEARQFHEHIRELRRRLAYFQRNDGYLDRRERLDLERRLQRLHDVMHEAHGDGHAEDAYGDDHDDHRPSR